MAHTSFGSFYRRGNSVTGRVLVPHHDLEATESGSSDSPFLTPPSRWSSTSNSPQSGTSSSLTVSIAQRMDHMLVMFGELKKRVEVESAETKERLAALQEDVKVMKEKQETLVLPKARKRLPSDLSVIHLYTVLKLMPLCFVCFFPSSQ